MAVIKILSDKQESLLRTCRNMLERCSQNTTETAKVPRFAELVTEMAQLVADIDAAMVAKQTSRDTTKVTEQKNQYVANLVVTLDELSRLAETIGIEKNNEIWRNNAEKGFRRSTKGISNETLVMVAREFIQFLKSIEEETLAHYGITAVEISEVEKDIQNIKDWRTKKEVAIGQKILDISSLATLLNQLDKIKSKMEIIGLRFAKLAPDFYSIYAKALVLNAKSGVKTARIKKDATAADSKKTLQAKKTAKTEKTKAVRNRKKAISDKGNAVTNGEVKPSNAGNDSASTVNA